MKEKFRNRKTRIQGLLLAACLVLVVCFCGQAFAEDRPTAAGFPDRTIIIGTYAIVLDAMTEEILALAEASAEENNQNRVYFKSDLNKGTWYDITNSTDISQISTDQENAVPNKTIDDLELTHYTKADGTTIDLSTGKSVSIAEITDLTDPRNMPEMEAVVTERDIQAEMSGGAAKDKVESIDRVLLLMRDPEEVEKNEKEDVEKIQTLKEQIGALEKSIQDLQNDPSVSARSVEIAVDEKMKLMDERDGLCYTIVYNRMKTETTELDYDDALDLIEKYASAMTNIKGTLAEMGQPDPEDEGESTGTESGTTDVMARKEEALSEELVQASLAENTAKIKEILEAMAVLDSLRQNEPNVSGEMKEKQLEMLEELRKDSIAAIDEAVAAINSDPDYAKAKADGTSASALEKMRSDMAEELADAFSQLMDINSLMDEREGDPRASEARMEETRALMGDAFDRVNPELQNAVGDVMMELQDELNQNMAEVQLGELEEYQQLQEAYEEYSEKAENFYEKYMEAVQNGEKEKAKAYKNLMELAAENRNAASEGMQQMEADVLNGDLQVSVEDGVIADANNTMDAVEDAMDLMKKNDKAAAAAPDPESIKEESVGGTAQNIVDTNIGDDRYTSSEIASLNKAVADLAKKDKDNTYLPPWNLVFSDVRVKLMSPLVQFGKNVYVPARELGDQLDCQVIMSKSSNAVVIRKGSGLIEFVEGNKTMYVNDKQMNVNPAPYKVYKGRVYIPLSCFEKALGYSQSNVDGKILMTKM